MVTPRSETLSTNTFSKSEPGVSETVNPFAENSKDDGVGALRAKGELCRDQACGGEKGRG